MTSVPAIEVFCVFLKLGLTSFGGPVAHIGYFRDEFVVQRKWLDDRAYADLVALCQFLPGPSSSQVGLSLGLLRAGFIGAMAAWIAFTLPSAAFLVLFARWAETISGPVGEGLVHGLKLTAVSIVAQALWSMGRTLCPDRERSSIALVAMVVVLVNTTPIAQGAAIVMGAMAGVWLCRSEASRLPSRWHVPISPASGLIFLVTFLVLLVGLPALANITGSTSVRLFDAFYRSGALVFGGGHVVLPLLNEAVVTPGWMSADAFVTGYAAVQAMPGPLFTFAAYLGASISSPGGVQGASLCLIAIFLPGVLVLLGVMPFWGALRRRAFARSAMIGINAAVVGLLGAALYDPIWIGAVRSHVDFGVVSCGFVLLTIWRAPPIVAVAFCVASTSLMSSI